MDSLSKIRTPTVKKLYRALEVLVTYHHSHHHTITLLTSHLHTLTPSHPHTLTLSHRHTHTQQELLPNVQYLFREREKEMKKKMIAELPRRTSDRIALKAQREEEVSEATPPRPHPQATPPFRSGWMLS